MFLRTIHAQSLRSHLEFGRCVTKGHERKDPDEDPDRVSRYTFEGTHIHRLGTREVSLSLNQPTAEEKSSLIPQPVPKINPLHVHRSPLEALDKGDSLERILDITMAPVLALDGGNRRDV